MIYTDKTKKAMEICFMAHRDQRDKSGLPYVFHPFHLAEEMDEEKTCVVALLHDVVEDTSITLEDLKSEGFDDEIICALALLTHNPKTPYMEYVAAIKQNPIAKAVKLADLKHNSDLSRLDVVTDAALERNKIYKEAIEFLNKEE